MNQDLHLLTNAELKRYIAENRNNAEAFHQALKVILSRRDPNAPVYSKPQINSEADIKAALAEFEPIFREKLRQIEQNDGQS